MSKVVTAAHVTGAIVTDIEDFTDITSWSVVRTIVDRTSCRGRAACLTIITYKNGRLVIPQDGLYFVYSQVQFLAYPRTHPLLVGHTHAQLSHSVLKWNQIYPNDGTKLIAQRSLSVRWQLGAADSEVDEQASYIGSLFDLQEGDQLFVRLSKFGILNDTTATFFGMYSVLGNL